MALLRPLRVLGLQPLVQPGLTLEANLAHAEELIKANPGYRLYVLPELSCNGYSDQVLASLEAHAQEAERGSIADFFSQLACEVEAYICYGFLRRDGPRFFICQGVVDPTGKLVLTYDKMHLCDMGACSEVGHGCSPGDRLGLFDCDGVRVGVTICYDIRFPELFRALAWDHGCDLVVHPAAFVRDATFPCYHQFCTTRAVENGIYLLSVNYAGAEFGDSVAVPPWVGPVPGLDTQLAIASLHIEEGALPIIVDPAVLVAVRAAYPYRRDVNPVLRARDSP